MATIKQTPGEELWEIAYGPKSPADALGKGTPKDRIKSFGGFGDDKKELLRIAKKLLKCSKLMQRKLETFIKKNSK